MLSLDQRNELSKGIGASECAAVLGIDPFRTPYELWMLKTGRLEREELAPLSPAMMGHLLEPLVATCYSKMTGKKLRKVNQAQHHQSYPHILCHPDRKIIGERKHVQIKTANPFSTMWGDAGTDEIPPSYIAQVQHEMAVTGDQEEDLIVFRGTTDLRIYPFKRDEAIISHIIDKINHFWNYHIFYDIPPDVTTRRDVLLKYPTNNGTFVEATSETYELLAAFKTIKEDIAMHETEKDAIEKDIIAFVGEADGIKDGENILLTFKANKNGKKSLLIKKGA